MNRQTEAQINVRQNYSAPLVPKNISALTYVNVCITLSSKLPDLSENIGHNGRVWLISSNYKKG